MSLNLPELSPTVGDGAEAGAPPPAGRSPRRRSALVWRRYRRSRSAVAGLVVFGLLVLFSLVGGVFSPYDHTSVDFTGLTEAPSADHPLGTTAGGNDVYAQAVHGLQRSLLIAVTVSLVTTAIAALVGAGAAYLGGGRTWGRRGERALLGLVHFLMVVPSFLILSLASQWATGDYRVLIVALSVLGWMTTARVVWTVATTLREREYVAAARFMGVPGRSIVLRHLIPNIGSLLIVTFTLNVVNTVQSETALSFVGFGVQVPDVSLGTMLADGANSMATAPWLLAVPAVLLLMLMLTISLAYVGDGLRDALDPTSQAGGRA
ncbi:ABC transporter permease [Pseudonocardia sp. HH130630-07]|uniref:ABC transporter permease n=1 Tax=Pseudonocardia sp. HH130630-07 TaxID=1690815 RepID=UPI0008150560|nr:ABC transporter permease [Pseudonocardia sp. HH130630-07]ANY08384.1 peptide ABC transporter permease [Pseudonocardia sp. HH130630-07]